MQVVLEVASLRPYPHTITAGEFRRLCAAQGVKATRYAASYETGRHVWRALAPA